MAISKQKVKLFLSLSIAIAIFGILFKIMHWPFAMVLLLCGCAGIALSYALRFYNKQPKRLLDYTKLLLLIFFLFHYTFKIFHWSYGSIFTRLTQIFLVISVLLYIRDVFFIEPNQENIDPPEKMKRKNETLSYFLYGIAAFGIIVGAQFKILHWEFNFINGNVLLAIGLLAVIASLFISTNDTEA